MNAKVSARVRAQAVRLLQCAYDSYWSAAFFAVIGENPATEGTAWRLAYGAYVAANRKVKHDTAVLYLEAAALLEDGWCPGDPVEVRR